MASPIIAESHSDRCADTSAQEIVEAVNFLIPLAIDPSTASATRMLCQREIATGLAKVTCDQVRNFASCVH